MHEYRVTPKHGTKLAQAKSIMILLLHVWISLFRLINIYATCKQHLPVSNINTGCNFIQDPRWRRHRQCAVRERAISEQCGLGLTVVGFWMSQGEKFLSSTVKRQQIIPEIQGTRIIALGVVHWVLLQTLARWILPPWQVHKLTNWEPFFGFTSGVMSWKFRTMIVAVMIAGGCVCYWWTG